METDPTGGVVGVDTDGTLRRLVGTGWENVGTTTGTVQALGVTGDGAIVLVDDRGGWALVHVPSINMYGWVNTNNIVR